MAEKFPFGKYFGEINLLAELQFEGEKPYFQNPPAAPEQKTLLLYLGCNILRTAHLAKTIVAVLRAMGFDFNTVGGPANCCGIIHHMNREPDAARAIAGGSLRNFAKYGPTQVLMWCPSCNEHYDEVVTQEHEVPFPYEHVTAFVARHLDRVRFVRPVEKRVALHYHTGRPQSDLDWTNTRTILRAIPGLSYVEIPNPAALGAHCSPRYIGRLGRAGWQAHLTELMQAAAAARVDALASIYHSCHREICGEQARYPFEIVNWVSLLGEAMGIEFPDVYKRHVLRGDPEASFAEFKDVIEARGLDPARARELFAKVFAPACEAPPTKTS